MLPKVYVGMPITFAEDHVGLFRRVADAMEGFLEPVLPADAEETFRWSLDIESELLDKVCSAMVSRDIRRLEGSDGALFFMPRPSIGVAMEMVYATNFGLPTLVAVPVSLLYHPWLRCHATKIVWSTDMFGRDLPHLVKLMRDLMNQT